MKLSSIRFENAERKSSYKKGVPGLVVAKCKSKEDKALVLQNKRKLKDSKSFKRVMIDSYKPKKQRVAVYNTPVLARIFCNKMTMRGNKLTKKSDSEQNMESESIKNSISGDERHVTQEARV